MPNRKRSRNLPSRKGFTPRTNRSEQATDPGAGTRCPGCGMTAPSRAGGRAGFGERRWDRGGTMSGRRSDSAAVRPFLSVRFYDDGEFSDRPFVAAPCPMRGQWPQSLERLEESREWPVGLKLA